MSEMAKIQGFVAKQAFLCYNRKNYIEKDCEKGEYYVNKQTESIPAWYGKWY